MATSASNVTEFKQRVQKEWSGDDTAAAWQKYYPQMREQLAQVTLALVDAASPRVGTSILDLASGTGEPSLSLARRTLVMACWQR
jgi:ubiquinone/menaquinone biosynthesis C-methylase UbiE